MAVQLWLYLLSWIFMYQVLYRSRRQLGGHGGIPCNLFPVHDSQNSLGKSAYLHLLRDRIRP
jgi:hypothetical protein